MNLRPLNRETVATTTHPVRILQFGEGNFLRAFVDWMIDIANEKGVTDSDIAIVTPRFRITPALETLHKQDGLYHVYLEGVKDGKPGKESRLVTSIADAFSPAADMERYESYITSPDLRFVISNTTEAGIRYEPEEMSGDNQSTFPGKVTKMLHKRFIRFNGAHDKGLIFLCCELIEDNGSTLRDFVLRHAAEGGLGNDFINWVKNSCIFCDTLVDRIVSGFPHDTIDELKEELGYDDNLIVKGELYHIWAIGGDGYLTAQRELPLDKAGLNVEFMPSIKKFRDKKVRILNGSHTGMVPVALQLGCETVMDAFDNRDVSEFINTMVEREVLPMIDEERETLERFSAGILERFYNPYIKHQLKSIALNSLSKWEARNYPTAKDYYSRNGKRADFELFTFAALLSLYGPGSGFNAQDTQEHLELINQVWNDNDYRSTVASIVNSNIFTENFEEHIPGFIDDTARYLSEIRRNGMSVALKQFIEAHKNG